MYWSIYKPSSCSFACAHLEAHADLRAMLGVKSTMTLNFADHQQAFGMGLGGESLRFHRVFVFLFSSTIFKFVLRS